MLEWITQIPSSPSISTWILEMLRGIRDNDRNSILIEIAHSSTQRLAVALADPELRPAAEPVFFFLLLGFQEIAN